jgi:hypothetical protein
MSKYLVINRARVINNRLQISESELYSRMYSREEVRKAECPQCLSRPGKNCTGKNGYERKSNHVQRVHAYHRQVLNLTRRKVSAKLTEHPKVELLVKKSKYNMEGKEMPTLVKKKSVAGKGIVVKKTSPATKKKEVATSTSLQKKGKVATPARAKKSVSTKASPAKVAPAKAKKSPLYTEADSTKKVAGMTFQKLSEKTGLGIDTEQFFVAVEILKGAQERKDINHRVKDLLPTTPRTSTPKAVSNLVSSVIGKLTTSGFAVQGNWKMVATAE